MHNTSHTMKQFLYRQIILSSRINSLRSLKIIICFYKKLLHCVIRILVRLRLYKLHLKYHCIPVTSAAMVRSFSSTGYIANARCRSRITGQMLGDDAD